MRPTRYIDRTRRYYAALGYERPYRWARFEDVPFSRPTRPIREMSLAVVTTAAPFQPELGDQGPGAAYNAAAKFHDIYAQPSDPVPDLRISHIAIDRDHSSAEDPGAYLPVAALRRAGARGSGWVFGLPTKRSHRATQEDVRKLAVEMRLKGVEAAVLVPNCPVCHQSVSIAARVLEQAGVPSVILGAARDIPEHVGVPRLLFSDVPLGNAAGLPRDQASQDLVAGLAMRLLAEATVPRTTWTSPLVWPGPPGWRLDYSNPDRLSAKELAARRARFDADKRTAKAKAKQ